MDKHSAVVRFLKAIFPEHERHAIFANLNPPFHTRDFTELDPQRDCYWSIAAFGPDAKTNLGDDALHTVALVIDDVGTKVPEGAVLLALGKPTAKVITSAGNTQWGYRLSKPVMRADWAGFFGGVEKLIGHPLEARAAQTLMRLPMGRNTKPANAGFEVALVEVNPEVEIDPDTIPHAHVKITVEGPTPEGALKKLSRERLRELVAMIPNTGDVDNRNPWIGVAAGIKAQCENAADGFEIWDEWCQTWLGDGKNSYDPDETWKAWDSLKDGKIKAEGGMLRARAEAADPGRFAQWKAKVVFDDGDVPPGPTPKSALCVLASGEFVKGFIPPDYLVKKLITKAFLYSLTGQTGAGKTSITLRLAATVALGRSFGGLGTKPSQVLYLAAENPVDIQMRWIALAAEMGFDVNSIPVFFVKGGFRISATMKELRGEAVRVGGDFGLVVVDTGPVFFEGEDENDRVAMRRHARIMRELIEVIPGKPTVIVNVHPTKNAGVDKLAPSGGGSFLNEVDGNLTAAKNEDQTIELGWQGKWRGVEFAPLHFLLKTVTHPRLVDSDGEAMPTVVCEHLSSAAKEVLEQTEFEDQGKMLAEMVRNPKASVAELAVHMGWLFPFTGKPAKSKAQKYVDKLIKQKLVKKHLQAWVVGGADKSKMNGNGGHTVPSGTVRHGTTGTKEY